MNNKGFSLIEVLLAALMIMLGVSGYVSLQSDFVRADAEWQLRHRALQLAQQKLEDLNNFSLLHTQAGTVAFADIADDQGGEMQAGELDVALNASGQNNYAFDMNWQVEKVFFVDTDNDKLADSWLADDDPALPVGIPEGAAQKRVTVRVEWLGLTGEPQSITVEGLIAPVLAGSSFLVGFYQKSLAQQARIAFDADRQVDNLGINQGESTLQSAAPLLTAATSLRQTDLSVEHYQELDGQRLKYKQSDFKTLACSCELAAEAPANTAGRMQLSQGQLVWQAPQRINKMTGIAVPQGQGALCEQCCHDHHDNQDSVASEQFFRLEAGYAHQHYLRQEDGSLQLAARAGDAYNEQCRFQRVNGTFVLWQDWQLLELVVLPSTYLDEPVNVSAYQQYVQALLQSHLLGLSLPAKPAGRDISVDERNQQLSARGIYLDYLTEAERRQLAEHIVIGADNWLGLLAFYEINLTLLADWSSSAPDIASVTNQPPSGMSDHTLDYYQHYSRGWLQILRSGDARISATIADNNAGLLGLPAISAYDAQKAARVDSVGLK